MTILLSRSATVYDVEGTSMFNQELGRTIARDRSLETDSFDRDAALTRAANAGQRSGFVERIQRAVIRPWHRELTTGADSGQTAGLAGSFDPIALRELVDGNPIR